MPQDDSSGFIVVECQEAPTPTSNRVCVPETWIKCKFLGGKTVAIAYPSENESRTATRLKNREPPDDEWKLYIGEIKYEAESYENAIIGFIKTGGKHTKENEYGNSQNESAAEADKPQPKSEKNKKPTKSLKKYLKTQLKTYARNKGNESKHKHIKQQTLKENIPNLKISTVGTVLGSIEPQVDTDSSTPSQNKQDNNILPKRLELKIDDVINGYVPQFLNNNNTENLAIDQEKQIDVSNTNFSAIDKQLLNNLQIEQNQALQKIKELTLDIKSLYLKVHQNKETLHQIFLKYQDRSPLGAIPVDEENYQNSNPFQDESFEEIENEEEDNKDYSEEEEEEEKETGEEESDREDVEMDYESDEQTFTDTESAPYLSFSSTPELFKKNPNKIDNAEEDTTWTLKHPHARKGLAELGNSGIYLSAAGLKKCKTKCCDVRTFARQLFKEVFTREALESCSLTGRRSVVGRTKGICKPSLHQRARSVIPSYAMDYAREVGWKAITLRELMQSIRAMLLRWSNKDRKYGSN